MNRLFSLVFFVLSFASILQAQPLFQEGASTKSSKLPQSPADFSELADHVAHAVVNISFEGGVDDEPEEGEEGGGHPLIPDKLFPQRSLGSGFIIHPDGYIVTNNHVIAASGKVSVRIPDDKTEYEAKVIGTDAKTDLALIRIEASRPLDVLPLGDSDDLRIGEWVLAVGNQFQLGQTFTAGIVSAKARRVPTRSSGPYDQFIQTDASINPGSSGGPLINTQGEVVGINTAIFSPGRQQFGGGSGFNIGIGFAIPINMAKDILVQLRKTGKVTRGLLGVIIQGVTPDIREAMDLPEAKGALVADVLENTPAERAGFRREDVIVRFRGVEIEDHDDLPLMVAKTPVGTVADVIVLRGGKFVTLQPKIGTLPEKIQPKKNEKPEPDKVGLIVEESTTRIAKVLGQSKPFGVIIESVEPGSAAEKAGLSRGDVIEEIDRKPVSDFAAYRELIDSLKKNRPVMVLVRRKEGTRFLTLKLQ
ncbi:MAG: Do family serine endopeptidase [Bdellovibrionales bacterium]|nr:Do family serine endopeptidase [Bdellovibrionales bacterium]